MSWLMIIILYAKEELLELSAPCSRCFTLSLYLSRSLTIPHNNFHLFLPVALLPPQGSSLTESYLQKVILKEYSSVFALGLELNPLVQFSLSHWQVARSWTLKLNSIWNFCAFSSPIHKTDDHHLRYSDSICWFRGQNDIRHKVWEPVHWLINVLIAVRGWNFILSASQCNRTVLLDPQG